MSSVALDTRNWVPVMGLEVHAQLRTETKLFSGCPTEFGKAPNAQVCPVCLGLPVSLLVMNGKAFEFALKAALALNCMIGLWLALTKVLKAVAILRHLRESCGIRSTSSLGEVSRGTTARFARLARPHAEALHDKLVAFST